MVGGVTSSFDSYGAHGLDIGAKYDRHESTTRMRWRKEAPAISWGSVAPNPWQYVAASPLRRSAPASQTIRSVLLSCQAEEIQIDFCKGSARMIAPGWANSDCGCETLTSPPMIWGSLRSRWVPSRRYLTSPSSSQGSDSTERYRGPRTRLLPLDCDCGSVLLVPAGPSQAVRLAFHSAK